jgi:hypothetical protein
MTKVSLVQIGHGSLGAYMTTIRIKLGRSDWGHVVVELSIEYNLMETCGHDNF